MVRWLCTVILVTIFAFLIYGSVQHVLRMSANDPQIQISQDFAVELSQGKAVRVGEDKIDIEKSLSTYVIIFDSNLNPVTSSAVLDGKTPVLPQGVFGYAGKNGENRFTWQPKNGVRSAAVLVSFGGKNPGYVLVGRSLREVEKREQDLAIEVVTAWVVALMFASLPFLINKRKN